MALVIYGIKNCNNMKKAFSFLDAHGKAYRFHDFKKEALSMDELMAIIGKVGIDSIVNTKGTTYKKLKEQGIKDITPAVILQNPSIIKRPLIVSYDDARVGHAFVGLQYLEELL